MARRNKGQDAPVENNEEAQVEAPEATTENTEQTETPAAEVDLTAFQSAVQSAKDEADTSTGEVPEASLAGVTAEYRKLDGIKAKNAAKRVVGDAMRDAMNSGDFAGARAYLMIQDNALVAAASGGGSKTERAPADPTENFVQRVATLNLASTLSQESVPEGVSEDWGSKVGDLVNTSLEQARAYTTWLEADEETRGDEPEVTAVVRNAVKLSQGKSAKAGTRSGGGGGTFTGERRDIGAHIVSAFEGKDEGTFLTIAEIRNTRSEEYGDNPPSAGAISARLFPSKGTSSMLKVGIRPDTQNNKKGAVKDSSVSE